MRVVIQLKQQHPSRRSSGFSLIEIMIVIAIVAVLASLAGPSFIRTTQRFRALSEISSFVGDLQFARTEAIKQGQPITLCASSDLANCLSATNTNWHTGWIIFIDPLADKTICATCLLRKQSSWANTDTFVVSGTTPAITFNRDGFRAVPASSAGKITFTLHTNPLNSNATQCVTLDTTGHQSTLSYGAPGCS